VMDLAGGMGSKTRTGVLLGTPAYMSPEQIKNSKDVDARSDIWSAGVMLYEMLAGRVAFPAPTEYARLTAVLNATPLALESIDPQLTRVSAVVRIAMQKDRTQRYATALEMARALSAAVGSEPGVAESPPISQLPNVPSVWMPIQASPAPALAGPGVQASPSSLGGQAPASIVLGSVVVAKGPGGTLTSSPGHAVTDPAPQVSVAAVARHGTLPSENLPMLSAPSGGKFGVRRSTVGVLVALALIVGFFLGLATARLR